MTVTNRLTGEVIELDDQTPEQIIESMIYVQQTIKLWESANKKLKDLAFHKIEAGFEHNGYAFRSTVVQRMTYDMHSIRQVFDEDEIAQFMTLKKTSVDNYIKEHLDELGDKATMLRNTMIEEGKSYPVVRLEKLTR